MQTNYITRADAKLPAAALAARVEALADAAPDAGVRFNAALQGGDRERVIAAIEAAGMEAIAFTPPAETGPTESAHDRARAKAAEAKRAFDARKVAERELPAAQAALDAQMRASVPDPKRVEAAVNAVNRHREVLGMDEVPMPDLAAMQAEIDRLNAAAA